jgi:hypothetical protein
MRKRESLKHGHSVRHSGAALEQHTPCPSGGKQGKDGRVRECNPRNLEILKKNLGQLLTVFIGRIWRLGYENLMVGAGRGEKG